MDKIFSARIDEAILNKVAFLAQKLHLSKKKVIEGAVEMYAQKMELASDINVFEQTRGAWKRPESAEQTIVRSKSAFRKSMQRHSR